jgi:hypothetical protein
MLYSKTGKFLHIKYDSVSTLDSWTPENPGIFYHHFYDDQQHNVKFVDCLDEIHWEYLRITPSAKLLHENCGETFNMLFVDQVAQLIVDRKIKPSQVFIIVADALHRSFLMTNLVARGIEGVNIDTYNFLMSKVSLDSFNTPIVKKFSILSRNYRVSRLQLYCKLLEANLLDQFLYSFYNIHPYEKTVFSVKDMISDLQNANTPVTDNIVEWLYNVPYSISSSDNVYDKWADVTYQTVASADFHVVIETFFDPFLSHVNGQYKKGHAPNFITEKMYKPVACKKPFIVFGPQYMLEDMRSMGYKTFNDFIDESYDTEESPEKRLEMIVREINRILSLSDAEYQSIVNSIQAICDYNFNVLVAQKNYTITNPAFTFIKDNTGWKY